MTARSLPAESRETLYGIQYLRAFAALAVVVPLVSPAWIIERH